MTHNELWQAALGEIELSISRANFITWFKNTAILSLKNGKVIIGVPNGFAKEWLENKYRSYILKALQNIQGDIKEINCVIYNYDDFGLNKTKSVDALKKPSCPVSIKDISAGIINEENNLNPRYTFESFVVGENNELARAACWAVSQNLGKMYNPLFIYGGVGLGKTHLLQSIGNEILKNCPEKKVRYVTAERFASELIDSIKNQKVDLFKQSYQKIDLLIIDDVQFLSGKEKTQHEFFHVFNALYQLNKQIVISSDRPPKAIPTLEERLRSRFEGGMIADINRPDLETRIAILKTKSAEKNVDLSEETARFIAENIKSNIRELEGALNRVIAASDLEQSKITLLFVKKVLSDIISSGRRKSVHYQHIIKVVSDFYDVRVEDLTTKGRRKEVALARQIAMYLMRIELNASYPGIGEQFGGRDHTTALYAFEKINKEIEGNENLKEAIVALREKIYTL